MYERNVTEMDDEIESVPLNERNITETEHVTRESYGRRMEKWNIQTYLTNTVSSLIVSTVSTCMIDIYII